MDEKVRAPLEQDVGDLKGEERILEREHLIEEGRGGLLS